ncbi:DUF599 domain-containing protein [Ensifer soli]|uniref:DUF599 domain-containing protein n=1 Tax=Ciceribacter sp. sgz301302 TaxID=3342379 RepID=UPI0035B98486
MLTIEDYVALAIFALLWTGFNWATDGERMLGRVSLTQLMNRQRRAWMRNTLTRDLKMIDTQIIAGLQAGTAFFASTTIFALGGCFALLGSSDQVQRIFNDLPFVFHGGRVALELKVGGLACIFGYAFFKFGWSYRLFNYCSILLGGVPMMAETARDRDHAERAVDRAARMNILAAKHFNAGLRAIFLSIGYLGWFVSPYVFVALSSLVIFVLVRRQFFSEARAALIESADP